MSIEYFDGFDAYPDADFALFWNSEGGLGAAVTASAGRFGASMRTLGGSTPSFARRTVVSASRKVIGVAFRLNAAPNTTSGGIIRLLEGTTEHVSVRFDATFTKLGVYRNGTLLATGATNIATGTWYYLEFDVTIHDTTGAYELRLNGSTTPELSATNVDTRNAGTGVVNALDLWNPYATNSVIIDFDDLYIDTNTFRGDVRCETLLPNGNGNSSVLVGSDGNSTDNYLLVDEAAQNGDTDYVTSGTAGDKDTYTYGNLTPTGGTVVGVKPILIARKDDAGVRTVASIARHSATEEDSAAVALTTSYLAIYDVRATKPGGGAWSISDVNAAEFGVKVVA